MLKKRVIDTTLLNKVRLNQHSADLSQALRAKLTKPLDFRTLLQSRLATFVLSIQGIPRRLHEGPTSGVRPQVFIVSTGSCLCSLLVRSLLSSGHVSALFWSCLCSLLVMSLLSSDHVSALFYSEIPTSCLYK
jgi:hypothetical protein